MERTGARHTTHDATLHSLEGIRVGTTTQRAVKKPQLTAGDLLSFELMSREYPRGVGATTGDSLVEVLKDPSRPAFLFGSTPPREGTTEEKARETCAKFAARSSVLATDGFIVYDIQDEEGRTSVERPFPFRKTMDASTYASYFMPVSGKECVECVVYKCVVDQDVDAFTNWLDMACDQHGHNSFTLVGQPTSSRQYKGPSLQDAASLLKERGGADFGCVCIAERHVKKGNEDENMLRKTRFGAEWFITQGIFNAGPLIKLINDYGALCRKSKITAKKVILTFAPCGREKTMKFIKWLGMDVPADVEKQILEAENPVMESVKILQDILVTILTQTAGCGVPLGINVESLSIFKDEISASHELFQLLQASLLNSRGSPWSVRWFCVQHHLTYQTAKNSSENLAIMEKEADTQRAASPHKRVFATRESGTRGRLIYNSSGTSMFDADKDERLTSGWGLTTNSISLNLWMLSMIGGVVGGAAAGYFAASKSARVTLGK
eukprot:GSChrysophyteH1.ASY1.ANO1.1271.1 assembled CDS